MQKTDQMIDQTTQATINRWLEGDFDSATKAEINRLKQEDPEGLIDAFYTHLDFGTGGLRGIMGVGTNRMNNYTVRSATSGLANYLLKQPAHERVIVGYDSRLHSRDFAIETARVLAAAGIKVLLYRELRPVPFVSFGVLEKKCAAGVMITASHNPPEYNGYKVYWDYGGQVLPPHDQGIIDEVKKIKDPTTIEMVDFPHPLIEEVGEEMDVAYLKRTHSLMFHPGDNLSKGEELKVVYTPLHGTGMTVVPKALKDWGFTNCTLVEEQAAPDGNFPTIKSPNPEEHDALTIGIKKLETVEGDLLIATDADADRIGVVVRTKRGPIFLNGNEVAVLSIEHICQALTQTHEMPPKPAFIKSIVTTELFSKIAEHYKTTCYDLLTGFKYFGEKIHEWLIEETKTKALHIPYHHFIFGAEESYGYLLGTHARDKDAIIAANLICEMALHQKLQGKTLIEALYEIYKKYGVYRERLASLTFEGKEGVSKMKEMMLALREKPPKEIGGIPVEIVEDYLSHTKTYLNSGHREPILLPQSDVLRFWLVDETKVVIRPSGTEPKIKLYCGVKKTGSFFDETTINETITACEKQTDDVIAFVKKLIL
ncbi:MAG: phospho-sugar mutase [Chlamydiia bacterium]|nr:phospho-sugar mutase [Chlamydiia bacterium]